MANYVYYKFEIFGHDSFYEKINFIKNLMLKRDEYDKSKIYLYFDDFLFRKNREKEDEFMMEISFRNHQPDDFEEWINEYFKNNGLTAKGTYFSEFNSDENEKWELPF